MSTRTVRMDDASEATLADLQRRTGLSISEVMRRSLRAYERELDSDITRRPYEVYQSLGLPGEGGYALAPAAKAKEAVAEIIRKKHGR
ncbi:MAG: ribbon-helix-helix protein, CopG family [Gemmatimonadota bacterium]|nr:ribbon-helix-helix protein, CopG family [Gemmatimonadota bacterium]MDE2866923.1 ribbon-helix-helix protein, CopG family [Gemmatimonadota bacterium]